MNKQTPEDEEDDATPQEMEFGDHPLPPSPLKEERVTPTVQSEKPQVNVTEPLAEKDEVKNAEKSSPRLSHGLSKPGPI